MKKAPIFLHGMSKAWAMTGFRIGYACAPAEVSENMMKLHQYAIMSAPTTGQKAAAGAGARRRRRGEMVAEYNRRRNYLIAAFADMGVPCHTPAGAFYAFPYIGDTRRVVGGVRDALLEEHGVAVVPGDALGKAARRAFTRCAYATGMDDIREAMARMTVFVDGHRTDLRRPPSALFSPRRRGTECRHLNSLRNARMHPALNYQQCQCLTLTINRIRTAIPLP